MNHESKLKRLAASIRRRRRLQDVTQEGLAKAIKIKSKATISKIEAGEYRIDWKMILLIATHLRDSELLLHWWEAEQELLGEQSEELVKPLAIINKLFLALKSQGAFSEIDS